MRLLGLDYGDKTIGVAVSDELGWTAQGIEVIRRKSKSTDMQRIQAIIAEYEIEEIIVGFPRNMDGTIGNRAELSQKYAESLKQEFNLPVHLWDERLTTAAAQRTLIAADMSRSKRKNVVDKIAASIILQGYLDFIRKR